MNRRELLAAAASLAGTALQGSEADQVRAVSRDDWGRLDERVLAWWNEDLTSTTEDQLRADTSKQALFLPFPFVALAPGSSYRAMYPYDTGFMNLALLAHERLDLVRNHLLNYLFLIDRYGYFPNTNAVWGLTRSHANILPGTLWQYYLATQDRDLLYSAYPRLKREFQQYWNAPHHQTPIGLATNRDLGDPELSPELASEAETAMDWMPIYNGDVRRCVPIGTNCILVRYAQVLALIAKEIGLANEAALFDQDAKRRAELIRKYCWNEKRGLFLEYDFLAEAQLPYVSECAYWTLWAGVATADQAHKLLTNLHLLEKQYGLAVTDKAYPDQHPDSAYMYKTSNGPRDLRGETLPEAPKEFIGGRGPLMWMYPAGWASTQLMVVIGLDAYGYAEPARRISNRFLAPMLEQYRKTGQLWEKYNVVDGSLVLPNSRYGNIPYHSFTSAAVVLLGRRLFDDRRIVL